MLRKYKNVVIRTAVLLVMLLFAAALAQEVSAFSVNGGTYKALSSYAGIKRFDYATKPVRENFIQSDMVDAEYTFRLGSKAVDAYFGSEANYTDTEGVKRKGFFLSKNEKGKCGVRYNKLFQYNNQWIDVKTTYMNWSLHHKTKAFAAGGFCSIWWTEIKWLKMKHEFFIAGTNTPIKVNGFFTYIDIDDEQGLGIPSDQIKKIWTNSKGTILNYKKEDGVTLIKSDDIIIPNRSHDNYSPQKAATATFSYQFSGKTHTQYVLDGNADNSNNVITFDAAKYIPSQLPSAKPPGIEKRVSDNDESEVTYNTAANMRESWTYKVNGLVPLETEPGNFYDGFCLADTLDSCLEIKNVKVYRDDSVNVSGDFTINQSGQTVTAAAKNYRESAFYGRNYQLRITAGVKSSASKKVLEKHGHYNSSNNSWVFRNTGRVIYKESSGETERLTNTVTTEIPVPALNITKTTGKTNYCVGDVVDYTVTVTQTRAKASASNLVITDDTLPDGILLLPESIRVSGITDYKTERLENGFKVMAGSLPQGKKITIQFQARATKAAVGKEAVNTARVTADFTEEKRAQVPVHIASFYITGKKIWDDSDNQDGLRPDSVVIRLLANGDKVKETSVTSKQDWVYRFDDLEPFDAQGERIQYKVEEQPVAGYSTKINGFEITNRHTPERITISGKKTWNDAGDFDQLRPKKAIVYLNADGKRVKAATITAEEKWAYSWTVDKFCDGKAIDYTVEEKPVEHYTTSLNGYNLVNTHVPYVIKLKKYEKLENGQMSENPVAGAAFIAYRSADPDAYLGKYKTDQNGELLINHLSPGDYYLVEESAPSGYLALKDRIEIKVFAETDGKILEGPCVTEKTIYNQRQYGSIQFIKRDNGGNSVEGAVFALYSDAACKNRINEYKTDQKGMFTAENLKWGKYYLKEITAPKGYLKSDQCWELNICADQLRYTIKGVNKQNQGTVILTKTDETEALRLQNAVYDLYKASGELLRENMKTDAAGELKVENLPWGGYYFKEKKPPQGYGISDERIRFTVNSTTGGMIQRVQAKDYAKRAELNITKRIRASDIHDAHGTPSFIFKVSGTSPDGEKSTFYQMVTFSQEFVKEHTDQEGNVEKTAVFSGLKAGTYTADEMQHQRYKLSEIKDLSENGQRKGNSVKFNLTEQPEGRATFINEKIDWRDYSDVKTKINMIKMHRKLTGLAVAYMGPKKLEGNSAFPKSSLKVTAVYDDGTERELGEEEFSVQKEDGSILHRVPKAAGDYTAAVLYTENGITARQTASYSVDAVLMQTVTFEVLGGEPLTPLIVEKFSSLSDYTKESYTPKRQGYFFKGWSKDRNLDKPFAVSQMIEADITLYAIWEQKHLNDYSWTEIKQLSDSGRAETVFSECFEKIQEDLKDGRLSEAAMKHTKAFTVKGRICHAMLMGFNQDQKADGTKAGISFLSYESILTSAYNTKLSNAGGWKESDLRNKMNAFLEEFPSELQNTIVPVRKTTCLNNGTALVKSVTEDKLWLPSQSEIYGAWGYEDEDLERSIFYTDPDYGALKSANGEGEQYKLFRSLVPDGKANGERALSIGLPWWLRSPAVDTDKYFCFVDKEGASR